MSEQEIIQNLVNDIAIELTDEFDKNFERKAFFDTQWKETRMPNQKGSLMMRTGSLRQSINHTIAGTEITWLSSLPYALIHNEGGEIKVTHKMKSFFWAMYYKSGGKEAEKNGGELNQEQVAWKAMALAPVGRVITIPKRQFIGNHPMVDQAIENCFEASKNEVEQFINKQFGL